MPWYEREDFVQLLELADDRKDVSPDYDTWRAKALAVAGQYLARGQALQLVTIKPGEFLAWLKSRNLPNTAAARLQYVELMAASTLVVIGPLPLQEADNVRIETGKREQNCA
jgi:hypothetical protein